MPQANVNNVSLHYTQAGSGSPLVLVHGFPLDIRIWEPVISELQAHARVIAIDLRGFGQSSATGPFTLATLADDVHALLQQLGATPACIAGLSMGGYVLLEYAKKYPLTMSSMALVDTKASADTAEARASRDRMITLAQQHGAKAVAEEMMPKMLAPQTLANRQDVVDRLRQIMTSQRPDTIASALAAMRDRPDHGEFLPSIAVPVKLIYGEHDAITPPKIGQELAAHIPQASLTVVRDAGHISTLEAPGEVAKALRELL